jgi:DNA-binding NarL/FixJ family response regulator
LLAPFLLCRYLWSPNWPLLVMVGAAEGVRAFSHARVHSMSVIKAYIVEDSPVILDSLIAMLEEMVPVKVVGTADSEPAAVAWLTRPDHEYDLVIIDIFLKRGSGLGVLKSLHEHAPAPRMVVLSNYATADMRRTCLQLGADRVFDKSNEIDALVQYCDNLATGDTGPGVVA